MTKTIPAKGALKNPGVFTPKTPGISTKKPRVFLP